jgi:hypothetical protein
VRPQHTQSPVVERKPYCCIIGTGGVPQSLLKYDEKSHSLPSRIENATAR